MGVKLLPPPRGLTCPTNSPETTGGLNPKAKPQFLDPPRGFTCPTNPPETTGGKLFSYIPWKDSLSGEVGGYPQALPEVVTLI